MRLEIECEGKARLGLEIECEGEARQGTVGIKKNQKIVRKVRREQSRAEQRRTKNTIFLSGVRYLSLLSIFTTHSSLLASIIIYVNEN